MLRKEIGMCPSPAIEFVLFRMALTQDSEKKKAISQFQLELRYGKPALKGNDLKSLGIPPALNIPRY